MAEIEDAIAAANLIRVLRNGILTYMEIAKLTGIPSGLLSKYASGKAIPNKSKVERILRLATANWIISKVVQNIVRDYLNGNDQMNLTPENLRLLSIYIKFQCNKNIDKIVTTISPVTVIASYISNALDKPLVLVYDEQYMPLKDSLILYLDEYNKTFHISRKALNFGDRVIIFEEKPDDITRQLLLYKLVVNAGAIVDRMFYLYSTNKLSVKKITNVLKIKSKNITILYKVS
jgi:adenine/guanine phosphoribosyltransferase-like PRPP-binding protein